MNNTYQKYYSKYKLQEKNTFSIYNIDTFIKKKFLEKDFELLSEIVSISNNNELNNEFRLKYLDTITDGNCCLHAFLQCVSSYYRKLTREEKISICAEFRIYLNKYIETHTNIILDNYYISIRQSFDTPEKKREFSQNYIKKINTTLEILKINNAWLLDDILEILSYVYKINILYEVDGIFRQYNINQHNTIFIRILIKDKEEKDYKGNHYESIMINYDYVLQNNFTLTKLIFLLHHQTNLNDLRDKIKINEVEEKLKFNTTKINLINTDLELINLCNIENENNMIINILIYSLFKINTLSSLNLFIKQFLENLKQQINANIDLFKIIIHQYCHSTYNNLTKIDNLINNFNNKFIDTFNKELLDLFNDINFLLYIIAIYYNINILLIDASLSTLKIYKALFSTNTIIIYIENKTYYASNVNKFSFNKIKNIFLKIIKEWLIKDTEKKNKIDNFLATAININTLQLKLNSIPLEHYILELTINNELSENEQLYLIFNSELRSITFNIPSNKINSFFNFFKDYNYPLFLEKLDISNCKLNNLQLNTIILSIKLDYTDKISSLKILILDGNNINNIEKLTVFANLIILSLNNTQITSITELQDLKYLHTLRISNCKSIIKFNFNKLSQIRMLEAHSNNISDISFMKNLQFLIILNLSNNQIGDISPLTQLINLEQLYLDYNNINEFKLEITKLKILGLAHNKLKSISQLTSYFRLKILFLQNNEIESVDFNFFYLNELYLNNNRIKNFNFTEILKLENLQKLNLENNDKISYTEKDLNDLYNNLPLLQLNL